MEQQMEKREGDRRTSPNPRTQPGVCSWAPTTCSFAGPGQTLSTGNCSSLVTPGHGQISQSLWTSLGLASFPPASWEAVASRAAPEGSKIGSALQQLTLSSLACASALHVAPGPNSAHLRWGPVPHFPGPAAPTAALFMPHNQPIWCPQPVLQGRGVCVRVRVRVCV